MSPLSLKPSGTAFIYTFPYLVYVDTLSEIKEKEIQFKEKTLRIYPFFRNGKANFLPMPPVDIHKIPFINSLNVRIPPEAKIANLSVIPSLERDSNGKHQLMTNWDESFQNPPRIMPMDSLRIDVWERDADIATNVSNECFSKLIQIVKVETKQWWLEHLTSASLLRATFSILRNGTPVDMPYSYGKGRTVSSDEIGINEGNWTNIIQKLELNEDIPLYKLLILDARYFASINDIRRTVLEVTIACEQARDVQYERIYNLKKTGKQFKLGRILTSNNLPNHLSDDLLRLTDGKHSYEQAESARFERIQDLWNVRGNIAHGRQNQFYKNGVRYEVNENNIGEYIKSVEHCIVWLESLYN